MLDENLHNLNKLKEEINTSKLFACFLPKELQAKLKEIDDKLLHMTHLIESFNRIFSDLGWCSYDTLNLALMEKAITDCEKYGIEAGERVLVEYYKTDINGIVYQLVNKSNVFLQRDLLIQKAFEDHFAGRYYASVPLFLMIIDGAVNDYTKSKGFFAKGTDVTAWDCLVGCSDVLQKQKCIFNEDRRQTTSEEIRMPYRNGILHGRDLNYGNEYVSCKCISLMFALADWMNLKDSEGQRKEKYERESNPPSIAESLRKHQQNAIDTSEIEKWQKRNVAIGVDISSNPTVEECADYPYLVPLIGGFQAWGDKNYGKLSSKFRNIFPKDLSDGKRSGECRKMFSSKEFVSFEIKEIEERSCVLTRILCEVHWNANDKTNEELLEFGCAYQNKDGKVAFPWRGDGEWVLTPWRIQGLYE